ncbi:ShlB/FhaC/HecB family hemolysin secretion/activation protein [Sphingomonas parva]|uniref:ShlB/FhaC/HecB family hemolysin secretion/activation protein n=1 Tax=Sphingomonas parva TaxID=2555898 RepID=A0A4Y8ZS20_9SPHN|nr:ShlB/FhaC/HecB family hemolysin secretion/activation protein [Sphingomonas parva]TFI58724.1 ShlB/FhaC/HecB family hemolysin secretion/activation protein [Sphingomonas parva]
MLTGFARGVLLLTSALTSAAAAAQQVPPAETQRPSLPSREQIERTEQPDAQPDSTVRIDSRGAIAPMPCALETSPLRVTLTSVTFQDPSGNPLHPDLLRLLAPIGTGPAGEQPIAVVCTIRDQVNAALSDAGYVALAQIPGQQIESGNLTITIVSARIVEVRVLGDLGPYRRLLESRIEALRSLDPLNRRDAERILLLTGDVPGVDVRLALRAAGQGARPGDVIGELSVETQRAQVLANVQNFGSRQLGEWIASVRGEMYGITGLADRTFLAYSNSIDWEEIRVLQGGHDFALTDGGLRAGLRGSLAWSRPDILNLDLRSRSSIATFELSQQLARSLAVQVKVGGGLELLDQQTRIHQSGTAIPFTRDRLRVGFLRLDGESRFFAPTGEVSGLLAGYAEIRKGLDIFDASEQGVSRGGFSPSRFEGNPQAFVARAELIGEVRPSRYFTIAGQAFGQWANDPLLNLEEFSLGNFTYGRGYDPGSNGGDRAYAFRLEPRLRLPIDLPLNVELTGFYDDVHLRNLDAGTTERSRRLRSVGGGVRLIKSGLFVVDALYAHPLDRVLTTDDVKPRDRFLVSLTAQLYPWRSR